MLYRIPLDRNALEEGKIFIDEKTNTPYCKQHGAMVVVSIIEKNGKIYNWYRCPICNAGVAYDGERSTNQKTFPKKEKDVDLSLFAENKQKFKEEFLKNHMFEDKKIEEMVKKLGEEAIELFNDTEIMFIVESFMKAEKDAKTS